MSDSKQPRNVHILATSCLAIIVFHLVANTYNVSCNTVPPQEAKEELVLASSDNESSDNKNENKTIIENKELILTERSITFYLRVAGRYYQWHKDIGSKLANEGEILKLAYASEFQIVTNQLCAQDTSECESLSFVWLVLSNVIEKLELTEQDNYSNVFVASPEEVENSLTRFKNTLKAKMYECIWSEAKEFVVYTIKVYTFYAIASLIRDSSTGQLETLVAAVLMKFSRYEDKFYVKYLLNTPRRLAFQFIGQLMSYEPNLSQCNQYNGINPRFHSTNIDLTEKIEGNFELHMYV